MAGDLPDAGHVFTPNRALTPNADSWKPDLARCRAAVTDGGRVAHFWQCTRAAKVQREVGWHGQRVTLGYCGQHDPLAVAERDRKRREKWDRESEERRVRWSAQERQAKLRDAAVEAIRQIATGHNDARGLAMDVLAKFNADS